MAKLIRSPRQAVLAILRRVLPRSLKRWLKRFWDPNEAMSPAEARIANERRRARIVAENPDVARRIPIVCLSIYDWSFRWQRPQQFMNELARRGHAVYWVSRTGAVSGRRPFRAGRVQAGVEEVELQLSRPLVEAEADGIDDGFIREVGEALAALRRDRGLAEAILYVQIPGWGRIALAARERFGWRVLYDCMDDWEDFPGVASDVAAQERDLVGEADAVIVSSEGLRTKWADSANRIELVRNGVDLEHFGRRPSTELLSDIDGPIVGYVGAIAEWFDVDLVADVARARPALKFVFVGRATVPTAALASLPNVHLLGEKPYELIPAYMARFDVCLIPFRLTSLTRATDPVKLYEYLSLGKAVVATPLPEVAAVAGDLVEVAASARELSAAIDRALATDSDDRRAQRVAFAETCGWPARVDRVEEVIREAHPRVSIVIVTWNNLEHTKLCLDSLERNTLYPNLEVIIVDNGSTDDTPEYLSDRACVVGPGRSVANGPASESDEPPRHPEQGRAEGRGEGPRESRTKSPASGNAAGCHPEQGRAEGRAEGPPEPRTISPESAAAPSRHPEQGRAEGRGEGPRESRTNSPEFARTALKVILNTDNRGFAAATNQGLAIATGERLVLLNNDTILPPGWLVKLARHLDDPMIGLVVPVTNFSGNESRIEVTYRDPDEMDEFAAEHTNAHEGETFDIRVAAMYCLAMRRDVWEAIGPLDERFTIGMFEDDDYSHRARLAGYRVICAEDAFVHHFGQASFGKLSPDDYERIFKRNRDLFEGKWGIEWSFPEARRPRSERSRDSAREVH